MTLSAETLNQNRQSDPVSALLVHGDDAIRERISHLLAKRSLITHGCKTAVEGVEKIYNHRPDLIILDTESEGVSGYQLCRLLKNDPDFHNIPLILLGERTQSYFKIINKFLSFRAGADAILCLEEIPMKLLKMIESLMEVYGTAGDFLQKKKETPSGQGSQALTRLINLSDKVIIESLIACEFRGLADLIAEKSQLNYMLFNLLDSVIHFDLCAIFFHDALPGPRSVSFYMPEGASLSTDVLEHLKNNFFKYFDADFEQTGKEFEYIGEIVSTVEQGASTFSRIEFKPQFEKGALIGAFAFYSKTDIDYSQLFPMSIIEQEIQFLMRLRHLYTKSESRSMIDPVTGAYNGHYFMRTLERELRRANRYELDLSLLLIEFANLPDLIESWETDFCRSTHLDALMTQSTQLLISCVRDSDIVALIEQHHFAIILPETALDNTAKVADRIQAKFSSEQLLIGENPLRLIPVIGVSGYRADLDDKMNTVSQLILRAKTSQPALTPSHDPSSEGTIN